MLINFFVSVAFAVLITGNVRAPRRAFVELIGCLAYLTNGA